MKPTQTLALDLEGTLISNAMSQFPRQGLYDFLITCESLFGVGNIVMFTTVKEKLFREIAIRLYSEGIVPKWFTTIRYIDWTGEIKDLTFVDEDPSRVLLVDDYEGVIHPQQKDQWLKIKPFESPYDPDNDLSHLLRSLEEIMSLVIRIKPADYDERDAVFELAKALATSYVVELPAFTLSFERILADDKAVLLVAKQGVKPVGYCLGTLHTTFYANGDIAWLEELYVLPEFRRTGVGEKLVNAFERWSQQHHAKLITLATRRADAFYLSIGYQQSAHYFKKQLPFSDQKVSYE